MLLRRYHRRRTKVDKVNEIEDKIKDIETKTTPVEPKVDLSELTVIELKGMARESGFTGYSNMTKSELIDLLEGD